MTTPEHPPTYSSYLALEEILGAQRPRSDEHDEMLFIIVHQVCELWFKQLLHDLHKLQERFSAADTPEVLRLLRRSHAVVRGLVGQLETLETMLPQRFHRFRDYLGDASGFQSVQFRELEALLGKQNRHAYEFHAEGSEARARIASANAAPTLFDSFLGYLAASGYAVPKDRLDGTGSADVTEVLRAVYADEGGAAGVAERMVDLDEAVQDWRYRHIKMVERMIGTRSGTGGSPGAEYLRRTLASPAFPELWAMHSG